MRNNNRMTKTFFIKKKNRGKLKWNQWSISDKESLLGNCVKVKRSDI